MRLIGVFIFLILVLFGCQNAEVERSIDIPQKDHVTNLTQIDTLFYLDDTRIRLVINNSESNEDLLLLPGWNFPIEHWTDSTNIFSFAEHHGINLLMPEMGKSIYQIDNYQTTRSDWRSEKSLTWLTDTLLQYIQQQFGIFTDSRNINVIGISTGARGAVALSYRQPKLFSNIVALSGDFCTVCYPNDNLYKGYFGEFSESNQTWKKEDLYTSPKSVETNYILAHGGKDRIVPFRQSEGLYVRLKESEIKASLLLYEQAGHDYPFWSSVIDSLLNYELYH